MFEDIFRRKKMVPDALLAYGFKMDRNYYRYDTNIQNAEFKLCVRIDDTGAVDTELIETGTGDPYVLYKTNASGTYVGEIRSQIETVLSKIAETCFRSAVFQSRQAEMAIQYVHDTFGDELEFLWTKFPDNAVWRRKDSEKWYGAILTVAGNKIGLKTERVVEIIDLRMDQSEAENILGRKNYHPGWHMNKKSWYTIVLDGSIPAEELKQSISESYALST